MAVRPLNEWITDEMKETYVVRRRADLERLREALRSLDFKEMGQIAHNLKGNAATYSFFDLEQIALKLEAAVTTESEPDLHNAVEQFSSWLRLHSA